MNYNNLHELINRYESNLEKIYDKEHDELFKWQAMDTWRREWFKPSDAFANFGDRFAAAKKDFSLFIDNSRMHPSAGVLKLWEQEPDTVEYLFRDILFSDANGSIGAVQNHMDAFLDEYEKLRQKYFPGNWSYKQDRHSASVFLAMNDPDFNYVFKSSEAQMMARYMDFGLNIGSGASFCLENYYRLCDEIVEELQKHESLLAKHGQYLHNRKIKLDPSYHLLAFDLMYCSRTYGYYKGLVAPSTGKTIKRAAISKSEDQVKKETERLALITALEQEIQALEQNCEGCEDISLIGVQVTYGKYGTGVVIEQNINKIEVRFTTVTKMFVLDKDYIARPRFENDDEIVDIFTRYGKTQKRIDQLRQQIERLQAKDKTNKM